MHGEAATPSPQSTCPQSVDVFVFVNLYGIQNGIKIRPRWLFWTPAAQASRTPDSLKHEGIIVIIVLIIMLDRF